MIETIGQYNAQTNPSIIKIDEERAQYWMDRGAQPTAQVKHLLRVQSRQAASTEA
ncbi:small ribosomal subunit protein bS16 [Svornostia abyssi]|uniref:small ribosomal subunit protein bS16 n=1 Tax=Svornostia abyssi TaxID=2898438 RepID=UPI0038659A04